MPTRSAYSVTDAQTVPTTAEAPAAAHQLVRDPVFGMEISPRETLASAEADQKRYWFCSSHCERAFLGNPAKYIPHAVDRRDSAAPSSSAAPPVGAPTPAAATHASSAAKQLAKDPICGVMVDKATALSAVRGNCKYYFCSESCIRAFESPERELKAMKTRVKIVLNTFP